MPMAAQIHCAALATATRDVWVCSALGEIVIREMQLGLR